MTVQNVISPPKVSKITDAPTPKISTFAADYNAKRTYNPVTSSKFAAITKLNI